MILSPRLHRSLEREIEELENVLTRLVKVSVALSENFNKESYANFEVILSDTINFLEVRNGG